MFILHIVLKWSYDPHSYERNFSNCVEKPEKLWTLNRVWARDLAMTVRHSNQLSYEATDVGSWSFSGFSTQLLIKLYSYLRGSYNVVSLNFISTIQYMIHFIRWHTVLVTVKQNYLKIESKNGQYRGTILHHSLRLERSRLPSAGLCRCLCTFFIIKSIMHAFWLVLTYHLL